MVYIKQIHYRSENKLQPVDRLFRDQYLWNINDTHDEQKSVIEIRT